MSEATKTQASRVRTGGLDGIVVTDTELSDVDGERGRLVLRGHSLEALAPTASLETVAALLWEGASPGDRDREAIVRAAFAEARIRAFSLLPRLGPLLSVPDAMDALRREGQVANADDWKRQLRPSLARARVEKV